MKEPKTIKGYISIIKWIEKITITDKSGFDKLSKNQQDALLELSAAISNRIEDIDEKTN
jgi:hypothetical protein